MPAKHTTDAKLDGLERLDRALHKTPGIVSYLLSMNIQFEKGREIYQKHSPSKAQRLKMSSALVPFIALCRINMSSPA